MATSQSIGPLRKDYHIGQGTYGTVYLAWDANNRPYAVKRNYVDQEIDFLGVVRELDLLDRTKQHPYIVSLRDVKYQSPFEGPLSPDGRPDCREDAIYFLFDPAQYDGLQLFHKVAASYRQLKCYMVQLLLGVEYLHGHRIIHRDIKPENLLWFGGRDPYMSESAGTIKLCDFGLAKPYTYQGCQTPEMATSWYRAPEICLQYPYYDYRADIWSLGCIFFEMVSKRPLIKVTQDRDQEVLKRIIQRIPVTRDQIQRLNPRFKGRVMRRRRESIRELLQLSHDKIQLFEETTGSYRDFIDLLEHLLVFDPATRYTATQALEHPFFDDLRPQIEAVRAKHAPDDQVKTVISIQACPERIWAAQIAFTLFNQRSEILDPVYFTPANTQIPDEELARYSVGWYQHRIIFQALSLFDRYLNWLSVQDQARSSSDGQGSFISRYQADLHFMVCVYLAMKYFKTMGIPPSFSQLVSAEYKTPKALEEAQRFEEHLVREVLQQRIYQETVYEAADQAGLYLDDGTVRNLLEAYGLINETLSMTVEEFFDRCLDRKSIA